MDNFIKPAWDVIESAPIRDITGESSFKNSFGDMKKIGGDIHTTVDINPASPGFGEAHSTMRLPGLPDTHFTG